MYLHCIKQSWDEGAFKKEQDNTIVNQLGHLQSVLGQLNRLRNCHAVHFKSLRLPPTD